MNDTTNLFKEALSQINSFNEGFIDNIFSIAKASNEKEIAFIQVIAALEPETRKELIDYWQKLRGKEFATDMVKDYLNTGKKEKVEANTENTLKKEALSKPKSDANKPVEQYYKNLRGKEYSKDMVKYPNINSEKLEVKAFSDSLKQHIANMPSDVASELLGFLEAKKN